LYRFVPGARVQRASPALVAQAAEFVTQINADRDATKLLGVASESCFSLGGHLSTIDRRIERLAALDLMAPRLQQAQTFIAGRLVPAWRHVREKIERRMAERDADPGEAISCQFLSPSDFGFHNALVDADGRATFLDFEYAGRDDPAKLICDFFCQPEIPVPRREMRPFTARLADGLGLHSDDLWRAGLLLDAYQIKWVCIILNEFVPVDAGRRAFAVDENREARAVHQLQLAEQILDTLMR
jgi:hypothetical protein